MTILVSPQEVAGLDLLLATKQNKLKPGNNISISADNTISITGTASYNIPIASSTVLGGVKIGAGLSIDVNGVVSATSTGGGGTTSDIQLINLGDQKWNKIYQPLSYKTNYSNGSTQGRWFSDGYRINPNVNFATADRPDIVYTMGAYNIGLPNGSREITTEAAWDWTVETHYDNSGPKPYGDFEWHQRMYDVKGGEHRLHSVYVNKTNGQSRHDFEGNVFQFMYTNPNGGNPLAFATLQEASLEIQSNVPGRVMGFKATAYDGVQVVINQIGGVGFIKVPGVFDMDGYVPVYESNAAAKTGGRKVGQNYYTHINGMKVLAMVE